MKSFGVHADYFRPISHDPKSVSSNVRRCRDASEGPVVSTPGWHFFDRVLPQKFPRFNIERQQATQINGVRKLFDVPAGVVRPDKDLTAGNDRRPVCLRSKFRRPQNVFAAFDVPGFGGGRGGESVVGVGSLAKRIRRGHNRVSSELYRFRSCVIGDSRTRGCTIAVSGRLRMPSSGSRHENSQQQRSGHCRATCDVRRC